jgi:3-methyladenine DNA glycosylase/8-oxoguanine DNA glycosylase
MGAAGRRTGALVVEVEPRSPYRLPARRWQDGVARTRGGVYERFLRIDCKPVLVRAWELRTEGKVAIAAVPAPRSWVVGEAAEAAGPDELEQAVAAVRHALAVDDDMSEFHQRFRRDPLIGPLIRRMPWLRARRCARPWEALAWAVTEQLIEARRAGVIQRRIVHRWGGELRLPEGVRPLRDIPGPEQIAALAPAELASMDLAPKRALALIKVAREVAAGRCDLMRAADDRRLAAISEIGPWTLQCLGLNGRGDMDSLPAGDLAYVKLVGHLAGLGRRATVVEVEEYYRPYAPYRGIVGLLTLAGLRKAFSGAPPLRYHPASPEFEAA